MMCFKAKTTKTEFAYSEWVESPSICQEDGNLSLKIAGAWVDCVPETLCEWIGEVDKNNVKIFIGDNVLERFPERSTQTHEGDNIPLGSYTEPMEPEIKEKLLTITFKKGSILYATLGEIEGMEDENYLFSYLPTINYNLKLAKELFSGYWAEYAGEKKERSFYWGEKGDDEGDLDYLLCEYKLESENDLIKYLGCEVTGNIHDEVNK